MIKAMTFINFLVLSQMLVTLILNKAYFKLAKQHHPDTQTGNEKMFKTINNAYDILKDKSLRTQYDELRNYELSGKKPDSFNDKYRDFRYADHKRSSARDYQSRSYYSGFKSEQDFYDFYTKNFYQKTTEGKSYEKAKAEWEQTRKKHEEYQRSTYESFNSKSKEDQRWESNDSHQSNKSQDSGPHQSYKSQESQRPNEQEFYYKSYYRNKDPSAGSDRYEKHSESNYGKYYESFKDKFYKSSRYTEAKKNTKNLYEEWKSGRFKWKDEKKYKDYIPDKSSPFHYINRDKVRRIMRNKGNFFKIINLTKGKTDMLFLNALKAYKNNQSKDSFNRGILYWKDFSKMFPLRWSICALLGMSLFYRLLVKYQI